MIHDKLGVIRLPIIPNEKINYSLKINEDLNIYTNLEKYDDLTWKGTSDDGIYIVKGSIDEEIINNISVIYPLTWERTLNSFNNFQEKLYKISDKIIQDLELIHTDKIDRVMFLDTTSTINIGSDKYYEQISLYSNTLTVNPNVYFSNDYDTFNYFDRAFTSGIIASLTWKKDGIVTNKLEELSLFDNSYAYFLNNYLDNNTYGTNLLEAYITNLEYSLEVSKSPETGIDFNKEEYLEVALKLKEYIEDSSIANEEKSNFFKEWYEKIKTKNIPSPEEILEKLKERR